MHPEVPSDPPRQVVELPTGPLTFTDEGEGPVVLALHGYPGSSRDWRWLAPVLSPHLRFITVDMPGMGDTPLATSPATDVDGRGDLALAVLDALELERPVLLSHSLGGTTAMSAAARAPQRVRALALLAPPGLRPHWKVPQARLQALAWLVNLRVVGPALAGPLARGFAAAGFSRHLSHSQRVHALRSAAGTSFERQAEHAATLASNAAPPCLVAWCQDDRLVPPDICAELAEALPEGPRLLFETGGHNLQKSQALEVGTALLDWLEDIG